MRKLISLLFILLLGRIWAQELVMEKYADEVAFTLLIPYNSLNFRQGSTEAEYQITIQIRNSRNRTVFSLNESLKYPKRDWLVGTALPFSFAHALPSGSYRAQIRLRHANLGGRLDLDRRFRVGADDVERGQPYLIARREGVDFIPKSTQSLSEHLDQAIILQRWSVAVDSIRVFSSTGYVTVHNPTSPLELDILSLLENQQDSAPRVVFYEENIQYRMDSFIYNQWFAYRQTYSLRDQINQIRYIASQNEWAVLRRVSNADLDEAIEQYWTLHDPSPGTARNEAREMFYQRVLIADERYTIHSRLQGWRSDQGRIFIKYGDPDEIRSEVHPLDSDPYIIWLYYKQNLRFVFTDSGGFGQYQLRNRDEEY